MDYYDARIKNRASTHKMLKRAGYADGGDVGPHESRQASQDLLDDQKNAGKFTHLIMPDDIRDSGPNPNVNRRGDIFRTDKAKTQADVPTLDGKSLMGRDSWNMASEDDAEHLDHEPYPMGKTNPDGSNSSDFKRGGKAKRNRS